MMFERIFGKSPIQSNAETLYSCAVKQARQPTFYADMGVPDTVDGRFDMIALHVFLILRRLKQDGAASQETSQALFDAMFTDMDRGLRELGAGDLGVGRRVKVMAKAFYGRIAAYDEGLMSDNSQLCEAILRNIFRGDDKERDKASLISGYLRGQADSLEHQSIKAILSGVVQFTLPEINDSGHNAP